MADDDARARRTTKATTGAKKAPVKKAATPPARKAASKKAAPVTKAPRAQKAAPPAKAAPARKAPAKKAAPAARAAKAGPAAPNRGAILAPRAKKAPAFRPAAEQTLEDDWEPPAPEPVREDPHARIRSLLRAAAAEVEGKAPPAPPRPAPPAPRQPDEEVTRVLVAPARPEDDEWLADDEVEAEEEEPFEEEVAAEPVEDDWDDDDLPEDDEDDWAAPEILEEAEDGEEMLTVASAPSPSLSARPAPARGPSLSPPTPPSPAPAPSPATEFTPPPFEVKPAKERKSGRSRLKVLFIVLGGLVALAALLAGAIWAYDNFRDEGVDYSELKVGDCFDSSASNEIRGIEVKPCSEPHNSEIFFIVTHPAGPTDAYPGKDALVQYAADNCLGQPLTDYVGIPLEQSKLKDFEIVPQESAWKEGRRVLVCGLDTGGEGDITGSVKGTRR
jgi:hypothetical protein